MRSAFKSPVITCINLTGTEPKGPKSQHSTSVNYYGVTHCYYEIIRRFIADPIAFTIISLWNQLLQKYYGCSLLQIDGCSCAISIRVHKILSCFKRLRISPPLTCKRHPGVKDSRAILWAHRPWITQVRDHQQSQFPGPARYHNAAWMFALVALILIDVGAFNSSAPTLMLYRCCFHLHNSGKTFCLQWCVFKLKKD